MNKNTIKCMVCDNHHIAGETHDCLKYTEADLAAKQVELLREIQDDARSKATDKREWKIDYIRGWNSYASVIQDKINKLEWK